MRASARLIETALQCGIRHFDTAPSYGEGQSELVLGEVLRGVTDVTIASKIGIPRPMRATGSWRGRMYRSFLRPALGTAPNLKRGLLTLAKMSRTAWLRKNHPAQSGRRIEPGSVIQELETSLALLRRAVLDLYLIHEPDEILINDGLLESLVALRRQGLIRAYGVAFGREALLSSDGMDVVQSAFPINAGQLTYFEDSATRIFHGVMRRPLRALTECNTISGPQALAAALRSNRQSAFLFSASTPRQIQEVVSVVRGEGALCES